MKLRSVLLKESCRKPHVNEQETLFHVEKLPGKKEKFELELVNDFGGMVRITHEASSILVPVSNTRYCEPDGQATTTPTETRASPPKTGK